MNRYDISKLKKCDNILKDEKAYFAVCSKEFQGLPGTEIKFGVYKIIHYGHLVCKTAQFH